MNPTDRSATKIPLYANYEIVSHNESRFDDLVSSFEYQLVESGIEFVNNENEGK